MSQIYDNWERIVSAVLRRERDRQTALNDSMELSSVSSQSSTTSNFSYMPSSSRFDHDPDHDQYSLVQRQIRSEIPMDYADLSLSHREWKAMLPFGKDEEVFRSAFLSFSLDQRTRKNCFFLGAMKLILSGRVAEDSSRHWKRKPHPKSRFSDVVELVDSFDFYIGAEIHAKKLSPETSYAAYVVFGYTEKYKNLESANSIVAFSDDGDYLKWRRRAAHFRSGNHRADGWMEVELGNFYVPQGKNRMIKAWLLGTNGYTESKNRLIVEGIEFRPLPSNIFKL